MPSWTQAPDAADQPLCFACCVCLQSRLDTSHMALPLRRSASRIYHGRESHSQSCAQLQLSHARRQVVSGSSDGTVRIWDARTCEVVLVMKPPQTAAGGEPAVGAVLALPQNPDQLIVVPRSSTACVMTLKGQVPSSSCVHRAALQYTMITPSA